MSGWRKSSHSSYNGNCPEVKPVWCKASASTAQGACVETAACTCGVLVRDSKDKRPGAPILTFTPAAWDAFISAIKAGQFA